MPEETAFVSQLQPGYYLEDFGGVTPGQINYTWTGSGGAPTFSYSVDAFSQQGLFVVSPGANPAISVQSPISSLRFTFTSGNVTAVGAQFFLTQEGGNIGQGTLRINLSDGTSTTFESSGVAFRGFTTSANGPVITSLEVTSLTGDRYPAVDHLYVGAMVPEPTTILAGGLVLLPIGVSLLRRRISA